MAGEKFMQHDTIGGIKVVIATQAGGAGNEDLIPSLDAAGLLNATMMPAGIGADTANIEVDGILAIGDYVNVYDNATTPNVRKADASALSTKAHGYVLAAYTDAQIAVVHFFGTNTGVTGLTAGDIFLSTTAGLVTNTAPTGSTEIVQKIGVAVSATAVQTEIQDPILLA